MDQLLVAATALAISIATIPVMIRLAPHLHLLDKPNARKIHTRPIPRVGGWGICLGTLFTVLIWLRPDPVSLSFLAGGFVILVAGALDDMRDMPALSKLGWQFLATLPAVTYGGVVVATVPILGSDIQLMSPVAIFLSWVALVGCINATNTSDGLDGLAAGATLLSMAGIAYLAYVAGASQLLVLTAASIGALFGFFRFNTHPAIIFMGDLGSQFLGFSVGFLALGLVQLGDSAITPWTLLLLTGLPTTDIVVVATRRILRGKSPIRPDKTHIHHRLLEIGLTHNQSVILVYFLQASFVFFAVALYRANAIQILTVYLIHVAVIYGLLTVAEKRSPSRLLGRLNPAQGRRPSDTPHPLVLWIPRLALETIVPLLLVLSVLFIRSVPTDFGVLGAALTFPLALGIKRSKSRSLVLRISVFVVATSVLYLYTSNLRGEVMIARIFEAAVMTGLALLAFVAVRFSPKRRREEFRTNSMDYLLVVFALLAIIALKTIPAIFNPYFLIYLPVVLYCCELLMVERRQRINWLPPAAIIASLTLALRGLLL